MKRLIAAIALIAAIIANTAFAGVPITKEGKIAPTDLVFIDMATTAASKSVADKGKPCGAVIILNGAWKGSGTANAKGTAEQNAIVASRLTSLSNATVFTVNEPTTEAYNEICRLGADAIVFVNPRDVVIAKGIYPASAYDDSQLVPEDQRVPMRQIDYPDAEALLK